MDKIDISILLVPLDGKYQLLAKLNGRFGLFEISRSEYDSSLDAGSLQYRGGYWLKPLPKKEDARRRKSLLNLIARLNEVGPNDSARKKLEKIGFRHYDLP